MVAANYQEGKRTITGVCERRVFEWEEVLKPHSRHQVKRFPPGPLAKNKTLHEVMNIYLIIERLLCLDGALRSHLSSSNAAATSEPAAGVRGSTPPAERGAVQRHVLNCSSVSAKRQNVTAGAFEKLYYS